MKFYLSILIILYSTFDLFAQTNTGRSYYERLISAQKEYEIALLSNDSSKIAEWSYILGKRYLALDNHSYANRYFMQALQIRKAHNHEAEMGKIYAQLFFQNNSLRRYKEAVEYGRLGAKYLLHKSVEPLHHITALELLRQIHIQEIKHSEFNSNTVNNSVDSVLFYSNKAIEICKILPSNINEGNIYLELGMMYLNLENPTESIKYCHNAINTYEKEVKKPYPHLLKTYILMNRAYMQAHQYKDFEKWINPIITLSDTTLGITYGTISEAHQLLANFYEKTGRFKNSLYHHKISKTYKTSEYEANKLALDEGVQLFYENHEKKYQLEAKNKEIAFQQQNNKVKSRINMIITIFLIAAIVTGIIFYQLYKKYQILSKENAYLLDEQNHRIKNNLQSVKDLLELQSMRITDPHAVQALEESMMRVEAIAMVHHGLYESGRLVEVDIEDYIPELIDGVLNAYARKDIEIRYQLDSIWLQADKIIPLGLILNELVTNSCKYAFTSIEKPLLEIKCISKNDEIYFTFRDNGIGFDMTTYDGNGGTFGLRIITLLTSKLKGEGQFLHTNGTCFKLVFKTESKKSLINNIPETI